MVDILDLTVPNTHLLCTVLGLPGIDISYVKYRNTVHEYLKKLYIATNGFDFQQFNTLKHINFRYPMGCTYAIRDLIQDKTMIHIGSGAGDLDMEFTKYCKTLYSIELNTDDFKISKNRAYNPYCKNHYIIQANIFEYDIPSADIYYFWCGYRIDIDILNFFIKNLIYGTFLIGVPQEFGKLQDFLLNIKKINILDNITITYIPFAYDESTDHQNKYVTSVNKRCPIFQHPIINNTPFTALTSKNWNEWQTFDNLCGVMFFIKIEYFK